MIYLVSLSSKSNKDCLFYLQRLMSHIRNILLTGFLLPFIIGGVSPDKSKVPLDKIKVDGGFISGSINPSENVHIFKGIPFAAPPLDH